MRCASREPEAHGVPSWVKTGTGVAGSPTLRDEGGGWPVWSNSWDAMADLHKSGGCAVPCANLL